MAPRSGFSSRFGFIAAAAGSAVGLGNIWKFPYETGENGGAAFLVIYLLCIFLIGFPIMVGEISLGRRAQSDPMGSYSKVGGGRWGLVGLFGVICGIMILSFYNVVAGWSFGYFVKIITGDLLGKPDYGAEFGSFASSITDNLIYSIVFMVITAFVVYRGVQGGIEAASKLLMPILFFILIGLIGYALTLDNAMEGVRYYLFPDFTKITVRTIYSALGQAFFSLSLGMGALITYGSYISKEENIVSAAAIVTIADSMVAFLAGLLIFPLVFSQGLEPSAGPGLVFVALPGIFEGMGPVVGRIIGGGFFLLLSVAALTSTISLLEVPTAYLVDQFKLSRRTAVFGLAAFIFLIGLPSMFSVGFAEFFTTFVRYEGADKSFLDVVEDLFSNVGLPLGGFLLSVFVSYRWGLNNMAEEIREGNANYAGSFVQGFIHLMLRWVCPLTLGIITLITILQKFFGVEISLLG